MMNLIVIPLGAFLASGIGFLAVRALIGLGMGTLTYAAIGVAFDQLFTLAQGHYNNMPTYALQIVGLAGFGQAIGIIIGAISFRLIFLMLPKLGVIPK